ncbi:MAG: restriction endonuclease subunit R, partial [Candidatus Dadabacteria bacterium]|nr:restriction endonuclease subunit R [Candidatus Dadabacteria bacterium]
ELVVTLSEDERKVIEEKERIYQAEGAFAGDAYFISRHISDIVANPWVAYGLAAKVFDALAARDSPKVLSGNLLFIIEETKKLLLSERDRLAEMVFRGLIVSGDIRFLVLGKNVGFRFPKTVQVSDRFHRLGGVPLERYLYEETDKKEYSNELEKGVAWFLDAHERLFFWFRNIVHDNYFLQGWKKNRIWPDFIFTSVDEKGNGVRSVFVAETKGAHLIGSEDTEYKRAVFDICNELAKRRVWTELGFDMDADEIRFEIIPESEWHRRIELLLSE